MSEAALRAVYAKLPAMACKGKCQDCCGPIAFTPLEAHIMEQAGADDNIVAVKDEEGGTYWLTELVCPLLDWKGDCSIYEDRPFICRLWGLTESMKCPHGCVPVGGHLSDREGVRLLAEAMEAGGAHFRSPDEIVAAFDANPDFLRSEVGKGMSNERRKFEQRTRDRRGIGRA